MGISDRGRAWMLVIGMGVGFGEVGVVVALGVLEIVLWGKLIGEKDVMR